MHVRIVWDDGVPVHYQATLANSYGGRRELIHGSEGAVRLAWTQGWDVQGKRDAGPGVGPSRIGSTRVRSQFVKVLTVRPVMVKMSTGIAILVTVNTHSHTSVRIQTRECYG